MFEAAFSSLLISLIKFLICSTRDLLSFVLDVNYGVHSLSCMDVSLGFSAMVGVDLDLFDKCLESVMVADS